jgi:membrane protein DedA with SNARE-associated domain
MAGIWEFVQRHGYTVVFVVVLVEQLGAPLPAVPVLLAMGAFAALGFYSLPLALLTAVAAAVAADALWFALGQRRGDTILKLLCRLSLEPDSCVRQTSKSFHRHGVWTLLFAKFVPGLSTAAPPLAGSAGVSWARFLVWDAAGSALWAGASLGAGTVLRREVERLAEGLTRIGGWAAIVLGAPLAAYLLFKLWHRERTLRLLRMARITAGELRMLMDAGPPPMVVDLRPQREVRRTGIKIPGAMVVDSEEVERTLREQASGQHLVFYCS